MLTLSRCETLLMSRFSNMLRLARPDIQASLSRILVCVPSLPHFPKAPPKTFLSGRTGQHEPLSSQQSSDRFTLRSPVQAAVAHHRSPPDGRSKLQAWTQCWTGAIPPLGSLRPLCCKKSAVRQEMRRRGKSHKRAIRRYRSQRQWMPTMKFAIIPTVKLHQVH